jgi:hypothetical protein
MRFSILLSLFLVSCGGPQFQDTLTTETDSGSDSNPPSTDVQIPPPDSRHTDVEGGFEVDAGTNSTDSDARDDSWPDDVILEPYCPTSEVYPNYSNTCYMWGANHGWTLTGCCLPDHGCGTVQQGMCRR